VFAANSFGDLGSNEMRTLFWLKLLVFTKPPEAPREPLSDTLMLGIGVAVFVN